MRRTAAVIGLATFLLAGCSPTYSSPDDRSHARGQAVLEQILTIDPQPRDVSVYGRFDGIGMTVSLSDMSFEASRDFLEQSLAVIGDSPLGKLPVSIQLHHASARDAPQPLKWLGFDPARSDRYFAAVEVWMTVLADAQAEFDGEFSVQASRVVGTVVVSDDRDLSVFRSELVSVLEAAGYTDPSILITTESG